MKLRYVILIYTLMAFALPYPESLAAGKGQPPLNCMIYMFGHAGLLHYTVNAIGWLMMWQVITWQRTIAAWATAAAAAYLIPSDNLIGWSVIIYYYLGMALCHMRKEKRLRLLLVTMAGLLIPHIAAAMHLTMLAAGYVARKIELSWQRTQ